MKNVQLVREGRGFNADALTKMQEAKASERARRSHPELCAKVAEFSKIRAIADDELGALWVQFRNTFHEDAKTTWDACVKQGASQAEAEIRVKKLEAAVGEKQKTDAVAAKAPEQPPAQPSQPQQTLVSEPSKGSKRRVS